MNADNTHENNNALRYLFLEAEYCNSRQELLSEEKIDELWDEFPEAMPIPERIALLSCIWDAAHLPKNRDRLASLSYAATAYNRKKEFLSDFGIHEVWGDRKSYYYIVFLRQEILGRIWDAAHTDQDDLDELMAISADRIRAVYGMYGDNLLDSFHAKYPALLAHAIDFS